MFTPASATVGLALFVKVTSEVLGAQTPFVIVHLSVTLNPALRPVTVVTGSKSSVIDAPFAAPTNVHWPDPLAGLFPAKVKLPLLHCSWLGPATDVVGVE